LLDVVLAGWTTFAFPAFNLTRLLCGVLQPNTIATGLRVWQKHGAVINRYIFDLFLLGFGQADKATLKFSNIITSNAGLIGDVPRRDAHKGTTSTCKVGIENILLSSHKDPLY